MAVSAVTGSAETWQMKIKVNVGYGYVKSNMRLQSSHAGYHRRLMCRPADLSGPSSIWLKALEFNMKHEMRSSPHNWTETHSGSFTNRKYKACAERPQFTHTHTHGRPEADFELNPIGCRAGLGLSLH